MTDFRFETEWSAAADRTGLDFSNSTFELGSPSSDDALSDLCRHLREFARSVGGVAIICEPAWEVVDGGFGPDPVGVDIGVVLEHDYNPAGTPLTMTTRLTYTDLLPDTTPRGWNAFCAVAESICSGLNRLLERAPDAPEAPPEPLEEHSIVVVFDVTAPSRQAAAQMIADLHLLNDGGAFRAAVDDYTAENHPNRAQLESWWFPEHDLKKVDGNDNASMTLVQDQRYY